jgi:nitroreductase
VRDFLPDPVPQDVIRKCVRIAQSAPSWVNAQEWKVYVAQGETCISPMNLRTVSYTYNPR